VNTDGTGKMIDGIGVKENAGMGGTVRIAGARTRDESAILTERTGNLLHEKKIAGFPQAEYGKWEIHAIVLAQLLSSLHPCQNKRMKLVCDILMNIIFTNTGSLKAVPAACPHSHNHNQNHNHNYNHTHHLPDQCLTQTCRTKVTKRVKRWMLSMRMTRP
jgi:hypothetical protein